MKAAFQDSDWEKGQCHGQKWGCEQTGCGVRVTFTF